MTDRLDLAPIRRQNEDEGSVPPHVLRALCDEVVRLRVEAAPSVPSLADALVGTVVKALGETYVRVRASENDGWTLGWRSTDAEGWVSSAWLLKAGAVVISVPREVA